MVGAEARPVPLLDHTDGGKALAHGRRRSVFRRVVEYDDLDVTVLQRFEAGEEQLARVRVDERDRDVRH